MKNKKHFMVAAAMSGLAAASMGLAVNSMGVFYEPVSKHLGVTTGTFGSHSTVLLLMMAVSSLLVPKILKKIGLKPMLVLGVGLVFLANVGMSMSHAMIWFYLFAAIKGFGVVLFSMIPIMSVLNNWFVSMKGTVTSVVASFSGLIGAAASPMLAYLIENAGWRNGYIAAGVGIILLCLPAILLSYTLDPKDCGLEPLGGTRKVDDTQQTAPFNRIEVSFLVFVCFAFLVNFIVGIVQFFPSYASSLGMSLQIGSMMLSMAQIGNVSSKLIVGIIVDFLGAIKATLLMILIGIIATVLLYIGGSVSIYLIGSLLFGVIYALASVSIPLLTERFFGKEHYGKAYATIQMMMYIGNAISQSLFGGMYDAFGNYLYVLLVVGGLFILLILTLSFVSKTKKRNDAKYYQSLEQS